MQSFEEDVVAPVNLAGPDPLASVSSLTSLTQVAPFLRAWMQAVESGWEPPLFLPRVQMGTVPALSLSVAEALGTSCCARVVQSGELAAIVCWDTILWRTNQ